MKTHVKPFQSNNKGKTNHCPALKEFTKRVWAKKGRGELIGWGSGGSAPQESSSEKGREKKLPRSPFGDNWNQEGGGGERGSEGNWRVDTQMPWGGS